MISVYERTIKEMNKQIVYKFCLDMMDHSAITPSLFQIFVCMIIIFCKRYTFISRPFVSIGNSIDATAPSKHTHPYIETAMFAE